MLVNFNVEKLDKLLYDFYRLTGLTVSVWDAQFRQLSYQPKEMRGFCRLIKSTPEGAERCFLCDKALCSECAATGLPATHYCHAGLVDTAMPIRFKDTVMGYLMFGQVTDAKADAAAVLSRLAAELALDEGELREEYARLEVYDGERTAAAAAILKAATRYLWLSRYIEIGYNTIASQIDGYIHAHIAGPITVGELCTALAISKNRLYAISHEWFKMPIGDYITDVRVREAKRLLATTDLSVGEVGARVGIADHNYFTKFFKTNAGIAPLAYRKQGNFAD